ncbi:MAG: hypothetical protein U0163_04545 [Gemmatimonadaceae bacterium]
MLLLGVASPILLRPQALPIRTSLGDGAVSGCTNIVDPQTPPVIAGSAEELRSLISRAQEASLVGDHAVARDAYRQALLLSPREPRLAYYLGREHEALAEALPAIRAYCRYLALERVCRGRR